MDGDKLQPIPPDATLAILQAIKHDAAHWAQSPHARIWRKAFESIARRLEPLAPGGDPDAFVPWKTTDIVVVPPEEAIYDSTEDYYRPCAAREGGKLSGRQ